MKWRMQFTVCLLATLMMGCTNSNLSTGIVDLPSTSIHLIHWQSDTYNLVEVPEPDDIFYLNDDRKQHFLSFYHNTENQDVRGHKRLARYLEKFLSGFTYKGDTYNADVASIEHAGNCLSLAILTTAYASLVDLKVEYRKVNSAPVYSRENGIMTMSSHVQTHVHAPAQINKDKYSFHFSKVVIDYFPSSNSTLGDAVTHADFVSMYYQNLAAKALLAEEIDNAYSLLSKAMQLSSNNIETLNTLAVLHKKSGNLVLAESIYKHVLEYTKGSVTVLSNYVILLEESGRTEDAALHETKYLEIEDDNPYRWYDLANQSYNQKKYRQALYFYQKSVDMAPYLHEAFFGQSKTHFQLGHKKAAIQAMQKATELAYTPMDEKLYSAKLNAIKYDY